MAREDDRTTTLDDAAAYERHRDDDEPDPLRPTRAEADRDAALDAAEERNRR